MALSVVKILTCPLKFDLYVRRHVEDGSKTCGSALREAASADGHKIRAVCKRVFFEIFFDRLLIDFWVFKNIEI